MRMQTWRLTSTVQAQMDETEVHLLVKQFDDSIELLRNGDSSRPLFVPWSPVVRTQFQFVELAWQQQKAILLKRPQVDRVKLVQAADQFLRVIDSFVFSIEHQLSSLTAILNLFQLLMMALAIGAAVIMVYTGYHYVIHPLSRLRDGLKKLNQHNFRYELKLRRMTNLVKLRKVSIEWQQPFKRFMAI